MPRPRSQRTPPPAAVDAPADGTTNGNVPPSTSVNPEELQYRRVRDPAQEQILRSLPGTLSQELKVDALAWRGGCFCCPANISFAQCMAGLWQAARRPAESAEALVHWGLNASNFLDYEAGPKSAFGRSLLLRAGFVALLPQLLTLDEEVPQSIALTPQVSFVQIFATGSRQLPLSTTPQLVMLGLLAMTTLTPVSLHAALAPPNGPALLSTLVRCLVTTTDDRLRSLVFQTLTEWLSICEDGPHLENDEEEWALAAQQERRDVGRSATAAPPVPPSQNAVIDSLVDLGLMPVLVNVLESSSNAAVLRDGCMLIFTLLAGSVGTAVGVRRGGGARRHGGAGHEPMHLGDMTASELPPGTHLEGRARCRARAALLKAGLVPVLLSALARRPSQLRYWLAINMGVLGARHLEMQWLMLVIARMCVLPPRRQDEGGHDGGVEEQLPPASSSDALNGSSSSSSRGKGGQSAAGGKTRGRTRNGDSGAAAASCPPTLTTEAERLRLVAVELVLQDTMFSPWLKDDRPRLSTAAAAAAESTAAPTEESVQASMDSISISSITGGSSSNGAVPESDVLRLQPQPVEAVDECIVDLTTEMDTLVAPPEAVAVPVKAVETEVSVEQLPDMRAVRLLSRAIAGCILRSCVLPDGTPLELLPPRERNATPDFRSLQRDRIRRAAEEARAVQAVASASAALDVLNRAVAAI